MSKNDVQQVRQPIKPVAPIVGDRGPVATKALPDKWEYYAMPGGQQHQLNDLGEAGWEVVAAVMLPVRGLMFFMKRRKV